MIRNYLLWTVLLLILTVLGTLILGRQSPVLDRDFAAEHRDDRIAAVRRAGVFRIPVIFNRNSRPEQRLFRVLERAAEALNARGGIRGVRLELTPSDVSGTLTDTLARLQSVCAPPGVAACIGPFSSVHVPQARSLASFAAVPLLSPVTVYSEKLPPLAGDTYATAFPPLRHLVGATIAHMRRNGVGSLLIVSPDGGTYGDLYSTLLERFGRQMGGFTEIRRVKYQTPFSRLAVAGSLEGVPRDLVDAVFYAGDAEDFPEFMGVYRGMGLSVPVYGTEVLNMPMIREGSYGVRILIPFFNTDYLAAVTGVEAGELVDEASPDLSFLSVWLISALAAELDREDYDPRRLPERLRGYFSRVYGELDPGAAFFIDEVSGEHGHPGETGEDVESLETGQEISEGGSGGAADGGTGTEGGGLN